MFRENDKGIEIKQILDLKWQQSSAISWASETNISINLRERASHHTPHPSTSLHTQTGHSLSINTGHFGDQLTQKPSRGILPAEMWRMFTRGQLPATKTRGLGRRVMYIIIPSFTSSVLWGKECFVLQSILNFIFLRYSLVVIIQNIFWFESLFYINRPTIIIIH